MASRSTRQDSMADKAKQIRDCIKAAREAAERAREAAEDKGFWDDVCSVLEDIASVATVIAGAASVVATGGTSALAIIALAGALLSANADEDRRRHRGGGRLRLRAEIRRRRGLDRQWRRCGRGTRKLYGDGLRRGRASRQNDPNGEHGGRGRSDSRAEGMPASAAGAPKELAWMPRQTASLERAHQRAAQREVSTLVEGLKETNKSFRRAKESILDARQSQSDSQMAAINVGRFA